jgi:hypothetical protein
MMYEMNNPGAAAANILVGIMNQQVAPNPGWSTPPSQNRYAAPHNAPQLVRRLADCFEEQITPPSSTPANNPLEFLADIAVGQPN